MKISQKIKKILKNYSYAPPVVQLNLARLFMHGKLSGTGKLLIYPIDQGFEHGPSSSFSENINSLDPLYHFKLASKAGLSALAAPLGFLQTGAIPYMGEIPLILKLNNGSKLSPGGKEANQATTACIDEAIRLGCIGIGFTIYPGVNKTYSLYEELAELIKEAQDKGLFVVAWSYPRGNMKKEDETALNIIDYGAHIACLLGAHIVKVKIPTDYISPIINSKAYDTSLIKNQSTRIGHVVKSCFNGKRVVIFSGGKKQPLEKIYDEAISIRDGGGYGAIIGRNCFQRPYEESLEMLKNLIQIYKTPI